MVNGRRLPLVEGPVALASPPRCPSAGGHLGQGRHPRPAPLGGGRVRGLGGLPRCLPGGCSLAPTSRRRNSRNSRNYRRGRPWEPARHVVGRGSDVAWQHRAQRQGSGAARIAARSTSSAPMDIPPRRRRATAGAGPAPRGLPPRRCAGRGLGGTPRPGRSTAIGRRPDDHQGVAEDRPPRSGLLLRRVRFLRGGRSGEAAALRCGRGQRGDRCARRRRVRRHAASRPLTRRRLRGWAARGLPRSDRPWRRR